MSLVDSARVREWALGTIAEWLPGYTDTLEDGHQRKITDISDVDQGPLTISVDRTSPNDGNPEVFVVDVTVIRRMPITNGQRWELVATVARSSRRRCISDGRHAVPG